MKGIHTSNPIQAWAFWIGRFPGSVSKWAAFWHYCSKAAQSTCQLPSGDLEMYVTEDILTLSFIKCGEMVPTPPFPFVLLPERTLGIIRGCHVANGWSNNRRHPRNTLRQGRQQHLFFLVYYQANQVLSTHQRPIGVAYLTCAISPSNFHYDAIKASEGACGKIPSGHVEIQTTVFMM